MLSETLAELREQAKAAGIPWRWVCERKEELLEIETRKRWAEVSARQVGWWSYVGWTSGSAPFWRHGFQARFGQRLRARTGLHDHSRLRSDRPIDPLPHSAL